MSENSTKGAAIARPPRQSVLSGRTRRWLVPLLLIAMALLLGELLVLAGVTGSAQSPDGSTAALLDAPRNAVVALISTATPTPSPTPTLTPQETAAKFVPQLETALAGATWDRALDLASIMQAVDPSGDQVRQWAFTTHLQYGQALVDAGQAAEAQGQFDQAVDLVPDDAEAKRWQQTTQLYLAGRQALDTGQWDPAIKSFTRAQKLIPDYADLFDRLVESYQRKGQAALEAKNWAVAVEALIQAHNRVPKSADVAALLSAAYRGQAEAALAAEEYNAAVETLTQAHERLPKDQAIESLLARAYRERGIARHQVLELKKAKADLEAALALRPQDAEAQTHLKRVEQRLSKRIVIDISEQRMYVYHGDKTVYNFRVSTGLRGRDTSTGHFQILDKIPMAYSRIWRLKMPYWMGVYWVHGIENGIHALPIRPDGSVMWGGLLGQRASYGCIILSNQAARQLYKWADVGTQVQIRP